MFCHQEVTETPYSYDNSNQSERSNRVFTNVNDLNFKYSFLNNKENRRNIAK